ncbi:MAG: tRNA (guanine(46)-N(7))-methyltransferase TrmB [Candidatus Binataceae bacterium]
MARMRKATRLWRDDEARAAAAPIMAEGRADYFAVDPRELFGREARLELELGAGRGDFILERAAAAPERDFLAVELAGTVAHLMAVRAGRRGLTNLRVLRMDARPLVHLMLAPRSVSACHIYFPDPWPKDRHAKHRLFTPDFVCGLVRVLVPGGPLYVATDVQDYARAIFSMLEAGSFVRTPIAVPGASLTGFARKFIAEGREIYAAAFVPPA